LRILRRRYTVTGIMAPDQRASYEVFLGNPHGRGPVLVVRTVGTRRYAYSLPARGLLTYPEAAAALQKTRMTVYLWVKKGVLRRTKKDGRWWIPVSEIKRYLTAHPHLPGEEKNPVPTPRNPGGKIIGYGPIAFEMTDAVTGKAVEVYTDDGVIEGLPNGDIEVWRPGGAVKWKRRKPPIRVKGTKLLDPVEPEGGE